MSDKLQELIWSIGFFIFSTSVASLFAVVAWKISGI